jgi:Tfp pilus assembly protein PilP
MKLTTGILVAGLMTGGLWAQNPNIINNVQSTMNTVQQKKTDDSNAALGITGGPAAQSAAKPAPGAQAKQVTAVPAKSSSTPVKSAPAPVPVATKVKAAPVAKQPAATHVVIAAKQTAPKAVSKNAVPGPTKISADAKAEDATKIAEAPKPPRPEEKKWAMSGKRDPFFSPVVQEASGSGCSTGKKCLEIGQINVRGVVKSENGFIAVVTNSLNKAYFLRENDPVFNGYVVRITGDAVVFQETVQDKLGKPLTREVTKRITTPAV